VELLDVTGRRLVAEAAGGDLWSKSADGAAWETIGFVALHRGSLERAGYSEEPLLTNNQSMPNMPAI
jgi:hypothetical protein